MKFRRLAFGLARSAVRSETEAQVRVGVSYVTYSEGGYIVKVGRELAFRKPDAAGKKKTYWLVALKAPMKWEPPHENEQISPEKRKEIERTITAALEYLKIEYEIY
ncbi:MAG TPA: hypothetical protein VFQ41_10100 [Candidatus Angelobacter sp.]|nr:hypothetical protein [Candidatus Angelobacter sp.]